MKTTWIKHLSLIFLSFLLLAASPPPEQCQEFKKAELEKIVDGDTIDFRVDLGFNIWSYVRVRVYGINTPETRSKSNAEHLAGLRSRAMAEELLKNAKKIKLVFHGQEKYGRWLADVYADEKSLAEELKSRGLAVPYFGGKRSEMIAINQPERTNKQEKK